MIKRTSRRSVAIKITDDGQVVVCCPKKFSLCEIEKIVKEKESWINKTINKVKQKYEYNQRFFNFENMYFLGKEYRLEVEKNYIKVGENVIKCKTNNVKKALKTWLIKEANSFILSRLEQISSILNIKYLSSKIIPARRNWGSCNSRKEIHLNYKLMMLPPICIDYVCVHELSHIKHMNHSKNFWNEVEKVLPNRKEIEKLMKSYSFVLELF